MPIGAFDDDLLGQSIVDLHLGGFRLVGDPFAAIRILLPQQGLLCLGEMRLDRFLQRLPGVWRGLVEKHRVHDRQGRTGRLFLQCSPIGAILGIAGISARTAIRLRVGHKSTMDATAPLQIVKYMVNIWLREIEAGTARNRLPPIIPLFFYHGPGEWTVPRSVVDMIDAPEQLAPLLRDFAYLLHDLGEIETLRLSRMPEVRAGLLALRVVHADDIPAELLDLMTGGPLAGSEFERHLMRYIVERMNLMPLMLEASLRRTKSDRWEALMGTVAEAWLEQGRAEGQAGIVLRLLELRFGEVPDAARERILGSSASELEAWADAVLGAASLDEALAARPDR